MLIIKIVLGILALSIILSLLSLKSESLKKEIGEVKSKLKKGRVIFQRPDSSSEG